MPFTAYIEDNIEPLNKLAYTISQFTAKKREIILEPLSETKTKSQIIIPSAKPPNYYDEENKMISELSKDILKYIDIISILSPDPEKYIFSVKFPPSQYLDELPKFYKRLERILIRPLSILHLPKIYKSIVLKMDQK